MLRFQSSISFRMVQPFAFLVVLTQKRDEGFKRIRDDARDKLPESLFAAAMELMRLWKNC
jgi:hypothetical protein